MNRKLERLGQLFVVDVVLELGLGGALSLEDEVYLNLLSLEEELFLLLCLVVPPVNQGLVDWEVVDLSLEWLFL